MGGTRIGGVEKSCIRTVHYMKPEERTMRMSGKENTPLFPLGSDPNAYSGNGARHEEDRIAPSRNRLSLPK